MGVARKVITELESRVEAQHREGVCIRVFWVKRGRTARTSYLSEELRGASIKYFVCAQAIVEIPALSDKKN